MNYDILIKETESFINSVIKQKYLLEDENSYDEMIIKRFQPILKNHPKIIELLLERKLIPAGSILFGLGNSDKYKTSLSNCYYIPIKNDSIESIYDNRREIARTFSFRGGVGTSITVLRPINTFVKNAAKTSSGAVSFMPGISNTAFEIGQNGRRGAALIDIDIRHPEILNFIWCKSKPDKIFPKDPMTGHQPNVNHANISIQITDKFMEAVEKDLNWDLIFPDTSFEKYNSEWDGVYDKWIDKGYPIVVYNTVNARELLMQIAEAAWISGDPGLLFRDTARKYSTGYFDKKLNVEGCNPCGEQWLPPYGNCLLSALVLYKYVINPYTKDAEFDIISFLEDVRNTVKFLDIMIDINKELHPLKAQRDTDEYGRRIGIEVTGLHDMLAMLNIDYGSEESIDKIDDIFRQKAIEEINASIDLAKDKGCAPCLKTKKSREAFINQPYIKRILNTLMKGNKTNIENNIMKYGLRNSAFNTIGPCGSISLIADNCTSGIEPIFEIEYFRESRLSDKKIRMIHLPLVKFIGEKVFEYSKDELKKKFKYNSAHEIDYFKRIKIQSVLQKWIDSSISSTINLKNETTIEDIYNIYLLSWKNGLKGVTVFRDGCKRGVLNLIEDDKDLIKKNIINEELVIKHLENEKGELNKTLRGYRYIKMWKGVKVYISVSVNSEGKIKEIFSNIPREAGFNKNGMYSEEGFLEKMAYWDAICRETSLLLRLNVPIDVIIKQLEKSGSSLVELPNIIANILKNHLTFSDEKIENIKKEKELGGYCSECGKNGVIFQGGCSVCVFCNNTSCG